MEQKVEGTVPFAIRNYLAYLLECAVDRGIHEVNMKTNNFVCLLLGLALSASVLGLFGGRSMLCVAQPDPNWMDHDRSRPQPARVDPGNASKAPSDAIVLFDGKDLAQWVAEDGSPTKWLVKDGYMECIRNSGLIRTLQNFGDCQLHIEFATPVPAQGSGQGRGNSGVLFGMGRYEIQVLDSYQNSTYVDGSAGSIYGQYPPLVNASRPPGEWQNFDVIYAAPKFGVEGNLLTPCRMTVFHNGVLIQNNAELTGPTSWLQRAPYTAHAEKLPIELQDHGNPVRYRNIWVRELGKPSRREFTFSQATLDLYAGVYGDSGPNNVEITRAGSQLFLKLDGVRMALYASSKTSFFAKETDVQADFTLGEDGKPEIVMISVGGEQVRQAKKKS